MSTKNNPGAYDCLAACAPDEPYFVLRANDPLAPGMVRGWAMQRAHQIFGGQKPNTPEAWAKVAEAVQCAHDMEVWLADKRLAPHERSTFQVPETEGKAN
jgi:hypothetical protein